MQSAFQPAESDPGNSRERIRAAYDPQLFSAMAEQFRELLTGHLQSVEASAGRVLNWAEPAENIAAVGEALTSADPYRMQVEQLAARFAELVQMALSRGHNLHDPRYIGHQVPASIPLAGLFDALGSVTNQVMAIYEMGPFASAVEYALVDRIGEQIGWEAGQFAGVVTHGGSLANTTALLTARNVMLGESWESGLAGRDPAPVLISHAEAHYCIARSAGILGIGTNQVIPAELDERRRMDPAKLDDLLTRLRRENRPIMAVVACACATPVGAFDPLEEIADVCARHEVWLHVDAAHGGAAIFSEQHRHLLAGLERADSLILDAHKMLFVPALCAFVFYRNRDHRFEAFRQEAPYLFDPSAPGLAEFDSGLKTVECTKRAAAFGLWGVWSLFGPELFGDLVDVTFGMGRCLYDKLRDADDFQPLHEPECNIVVFRHLPEPLRHESPETIGRFQLDLRRRIIRSGEYYIVPTKKDGVPALRVTVINPLTTPDHLDGLLDALRRHGQQLLAESVGTGRSAD